MSLLFFICFTLEFSAQRVKYLIVKRLYKELKYFYNLLILD
jgi:hypothetical protein